MDYLHWHAQFEDSYPLFFKTCFNHSCLTAFAECSGIEIEGDSTAEKAEDFWGHVDAVWDWILMPSHHTSNTSLPATKCTPNRAALAHRPGLQWTPRFRR